MNWGCTSLPRRFWKHVAPEPNSGCWLWVGAESGGRGQVRWKVEGEWKVVTAYRLTMSAAGRLELVGEMHVDHRCETPLCVNPSHLDPVTNIENVARHWIRHRQNETGVHIHQQINAARIRHGWSVARLLLLSALPIQASSLNRKLNGATPMTTAEAETLVDTIQFFGGDLEIEWPRKQVA